MMSRKEVEITPRHRPTEYVKAYALGIALGVSSTFFIIAIAVMEWGSGDFWHRISVIVNLWLIFILIAMAGALLAIGRIAFMKLRTKEYIEPGPSGIYVRHGNQYKALPPLAPVLPATKVEEDQQPDPIAIPRISEMINRNILVNTSSDRQLYCAGFYPNGDPFFREWPAFIGVVGAQNTGKSVTIAGLAIIALWLGMEVTVCDPHNKDRALYNKLYPLDGYITFATSKDDIEHEVVNFSKELEYCKLHGTRRKPKVLIMDEIASMMRSDIMEIIANSMDEASQEGHGFNLFMIIAIHDLSNKGIGFSRIRDFLSFIYCHRVQHGQAKFVRAFQGWVDNGRVDDIIAALPQGYVVTRDEFDSVGQFIMPFCDHTDALAAKSILDTEKTDVEPDYILPPLQDDLGSNIAMQEALHDEPNEEDPVLTEALAYYRQGNKGRGRLAKAMGVSPYKAKEYLDKMSAKGWI